MRENMGLYRGKRKDNGKWVEGAFLHLNVGRDFICDGTVWIGTLQPVKYEVDPETVGQFTGMTDKNGKKIFEGDILEYTSKMVNMRSGLPTGRTCTQRSVVEWGGYRWNRKEIYNTQWTSNWNNYGYTTDLYPNIVADYAEVIGNIHDNPEPLTKNSAIDSTLDKP